MGIRRGGEGWGEGNREKKTRTEWEKSEAE